MTVGLGPDEKMTEMDIDWPIGIKEVLHDLAANSIYVIRVGQGIEKRVPLPPVTRAESASAISAQLGDGVSAPEHPATRRNPSSKVCDMRECESSTSLMDRPIKTTGNRTYHRR